MGKKSPYKSKAQIKREEEEEEEKEEEEEREDPSWTPTSARQASTRRRTSNARRTTKAPDPVVPEVSEESEQENSDVQSGPIPEKSPEPAASGIKIRFSFSSGNRSPGVASNPSAGERPEITTSRGGISPPSLSIHDIATHRLFAGKRLPGKSDSLDLHSDSKPTASLRPASSVHSLAGPAVREESSPLPSPGEQISSDSVSFDSLFDSPEPETAGQVPQIETAERFRHSSIEPENQSEELTEDEMGKRRGPSVPASSRRPGHSTQGSSPIPALLPESRAHLEQRTRDRQSREHQSQEEARQRLAQGKQARQQQARETRLPPPLPPLPPPRQLPSLPGSVGRSNSDARYAVC